MYRTVIGACLLSAILPASPVLAENRNADGRSVGNGGAVVVDVSDASTPSPGASSGEGAAAGPSSVECEYYAISDGNDANLTDPSTFTRGDRVFVSCVDQATGTVVFADEVTWNPGVSPTVPPRVLAEHAEADLVLPLPAPRSWPGIDRPQITGVATWLHVENFTPAQRSASAGPVTATVYAAPVSVRWDMGDGGSVTCADGGAVYVEGGSTSCSYGFVNRSTATRDRVFHGRVSITWHLRWDSNVGQSGDLGDVARTAGIDWTVNEIQALIR